MTTPAATTPVPRLLEGRHALVTGGGSGIGRATCLALAREGAAVCVADRHGDAAREVAETIAAGGGRALALTADVADEAEVRDMVEEAVAAFGPLQACFNNAGIGVTGSIGAGRLLDEIESGDWQRMLAVNLTGVFLCLKHELRSMRAHGGAIVNMASIGGLAALSAGAGPYVAAKHGVVGLTRQAALEYARFGIRVNAICPGHVTTPLIGDDPQRLAALATMNPMRRLGAPAEIAEAVAWLLSDRASFVNGAAMVADGGRLAGA